MAYDCCVWNSSSDGTETIIFLYISRGRETSSYPIYAELLWSEVRDFDSTKDKAIPVEKKIETRFFVAPVGFLRMTICFGVEFDKIEFRFILRE